MWVIKLLSFAWPFFKEALLGKKTVRQAVKSNKMKLFLLLFLCSTFVISCLSVPRLYVLADEVVKLTKKNEAQTLVINQLTIKVKELEAKVKKPPNESEPSTVTVHGKRLPKEKKVNEKDSIKNRFDKIKQKESSDS